MSGIGETCEVCNGTGWAVSPDGGNGAASVCECRKPGSNNDLCRQLLGGAGMERRELKMCDRLWDESAQPRPTWLVEWVDVALLPADERPDSWCPVVTMLGLPGRGKTMAAAKAAYRYVRRGGRGVLWCNSAVALEQAMRERRTDVVGVRFEERIASAPLLVLDDLFNHRNRPNWDETASAWLTYRERAEYATIITANLPDLAATATVDGKQVPRIDARIASRLSGGIVRKMSGPDYRTRTVVSIAGGTKS